jgi:hypothetical protein
LTVVELSHLEADIPSTPANTVRLGNSPVKRHDLARAGGATANDFDRDFTKNPPLVLLEDAVAAGDPVKLKVQVRPNGIPVHWSALRATDDHKKVRALSGDPTITQKAASPLEADLLTDAAGSFHVRAFVDCNGSNKFEQDVDQEPFLLMNLVLVRAEGKRNASRARPTNAGLIPPLPTATTGVGVSTGSFANGAGAAVHNKAKVTVIGGGPDGRRGLDLLFAGWVNNELSVASSPTVPPTEDVVSEYLDTTGATPVTHRRVSVWTSIGAGTTFGPHGAAPTVVAGPVLDTTNFGSEGTGGNTAVGTEGAVGPPTPIQKDDASVGQHWTIEMWDSPGDSCPPAHGFLPGTLVVYRFNLDFRSDLVFWTNTTGVPDPTPDPACRLYSTVQTNHWSIRFAMAFNATTGAALAVPKVNVSLQRDAQPTRRAASAATKGLEIRSPISLNLLATDART